MKLPIFVILTSLLGIVSCAQNKSNPETETDIQTDMDSKTIVNIPTASFQEIDSTGILLFPLSIGGEGKDRKFSSYKDNYYGHWNLIFYNTQTSQYHLLTDKKMIIKNYQTDIDKVNKSSHNYIFYTIISDDYNKDKTLNDKDPHYLYISDKSGNSFRQISPSCYNLVNWKFIRNTNKVVMTVKKDSNKDLEFNEKDEISAFEIDLTTPNSQPKEIFSTDFKNQINSLQDRYWKQGK